MARRGLAFTCLVVMGLTPAAPASAATINFLDSGWWNENGEHFATIKNYIAGQTGTQFEHNFVVFDLSSVSGAVTAATLRLFNPINGYQSGDPTETFQLFDVSTPIAALRASGVGQIGIFDDLGSGTIFGTRIVSAADNNTVVEITFNAAGIAAIQAALGGLFAVGGAVTSLNPALNNEFVFGFSGTSPAHVRELVLEGVFVPEPSTLALIGCGVAAIVARHRRR